MRKFTSGEDVEDRWGLLAAGGFPLLASTAPLPGSPTVGEAQGIAHGFSMLFPRDGSSTREPVRITDSQALPRLSEAGAHKSLSAVCSEWHLLPAAQGTTAFFS